MHEVVSLYDNEVVSLYDKAQVAQLSARTPVGDAIAQAAKRLIGTPFRLYGRDPKFGLDCVGLVLAALQSAGIEPKRLPSYRLRNADLGALIAAVDLDQLQPVSAFKSAGAETDNAIEASAPASRQKSAATSVPGDILMVRCGPAQFHLLIAAEPCQTQRSSSCRYIHAHASLRRVVASPGPLPWPILHQWRAAGPAKRQRRNIVR